MIFNLSVVTTYNQNLKLLMLVGFIVLWIGQFCFETVKVYYGQIPLSNLVLIFSLIAFVNSIKISIPRLDRQYFLDVFACFCMGISLSAIAHGLKLTPDFDFDDLSIHQLVTFIIITSFAETGFYHCFLKDNFRKNSSLILLVEVLIYSFVPFVLMFWSEIKHFPSFALIAVIQTIFGYYVFHHFHRMDSPFKNWIFHMTFRGSIILGFWQIYQPYGLIE